MNLKGHGHALLMACAVSTNWIFTDAKHLRFQPQSNQWSAHIKAMETHRKCCIKKAHRWWRTSN